MPTDKFEEYYKAYLKEQEERKTSYNTPTKPYRETREIDRAKALAGPVQPQAPTSEDKSNMFKALGYGLWSAADTGLFGLPSYMAGTADEEFFEDVAGTTAGQIAGGLGSALGYLAPMGWVGRGTSALIRGAGRLTGAATTRGLQKQAASKVLDGLSKRVLNPTTKAALKEDDALRMVKDITDPYIGTKMKAPFLKKILPWTHSPAKSMEMSRKAIDDAARNMTVNLPSKIASEFAKRNIPLRRGAAQAIADDIIKVTARKPLNSIESVISNRLGAKYTPAVADIAKRVAARSIQEAVDLGITGTLMDYIRSKEEKGQPFNFGDSVVRHGVLGGMFGFVSFIPGGSSEQLYKTFWRGFINRGAKYNKTVDKMSMRQLKIAAQDQAKNGMNLTYTKDGIKRNLTSRDLDLNTGLQDADRHILTNALKQYNVEATKELRKAFPKHATEDVIKSLPRMGAGAVAAGLDLAFNGEWDNIEPEMLAFHLGLGAVMTKRGYALLEGNRSSMLGDKDIYYPQEIHDKIRNIEAMGASMDYMRENFVDPTPNMYGDMVAKVDNPDIDFILEEMDKKGIIWKTTNTEGENIAPPKTTVDVPVTASKEFELNELLYPAMTVARAKGYGFHSDIDMNKAQEVLDAVKNRNSVVLSTEDHLQPLNNPYAIESSIASHSKREWESWENDMLDFFKNEMEIITGSRIVDENGVFPDIEVDYGKIKGEGFALIRSNIRKIAIVKQKLKEEGLINTILQSFQRNLVEHRKEIAYILDFRLVLVQELCI